jgi:hypothetical protein
LQGIQKLPEDNLIKWFDGIKGWNKYFNMLPNPDNNCRQAHVSVMAVMVSFNGILSREAP